MDCLFKEDYEYITEDLKFGDYNVKIKGIEPDYGQIDACLSQVRWNAAAPMIDFFKSHYLDKSETPITKDKQGIELGSGTGVLGLFIAKYAKFDKFYLTDFDENSVALIKENLQLNGMNDSSKYSAFGLDWGTCQNNEELKDKKDQIDFIFGSDIIYSEQATKDLSNAISYFLKPDGECMVANHIIRVNKLEDKFERECTNKGLKVEFQGFIGEEKNIKLHRVTKACVLYEYC